MGLVEVDLVYDAVGAEIVRSSLQSAGIDAVLFDSGVASLFGGGMQGVRVMVPAADEARARALLASFNAA
jgi:hypothetical protein